MKGNNIIVALLTLVFFMITGCKKEIVNNEYGSGKVKANKDRLLASYFKDLHIEILDPIVIRKSKGQIKDILAEKKLEAVLHLKDSAWSGYSGKSSFYESDEMIVTPDNESYVYPGAIIKAASINSGDFSPLKGYNKMPVRVGVTFPSDKAFGTLVSPALSTSRVFLRDALMSSGFQGTQLLDFQFGSSFFSYYNEVKLSYGYNLNEKRLFSSVNSSFNHNSAKTSYSTGLIATYTVKNFQYYMQDPVKGELIDMSTLNSNIFEGVSPVYINSITYGRFGFLLIEANNNSAQMQSAFEKMVKKIFKKTNEFLTVEEKNLVASCRVTLYLLGSPNGASVTELLINPGADNLSDFISESLGGFTANDPGVPISFTAKYLKNNEKFKTIFQIDFPN